MKKNILISLLVVAMGVIAFVGCEKPDSIEPGERQSQQDSTICDTSVVSITRIHPEWEYDDWDCALDFPDDMCQVCDYDNGGNNAKWLVAMNDEETYREFFGTCNEMPPIDFSNHTVFAISGRTTTTREDVKFRIINGKIVIDIVLDESGSAINWGWKLAFYTDRKININSEYEINITKYPIE